MTIVNAPDRVVKQFEARYVYPRPGGFKESAEKGNLSVSDPDDPVWEDVFAKPPYDGDPSGRLEVSEVTRLFDAEHQDGEVVKTRAIKGGPCHMNKAREFLYEFSRLQAQGSPTPWDQERHFRDAKEAYERAEREGKAEDRLLTQELLKALIAKPDPVRSVSPGSLVTEGSKESSKS